MLNAKKLKLKTTEVYIFYEIITILLFFFFNSALTVNIFGILSLLSFRRKWFM